MGQILHGSARTTAAVRRAIQHSQESLRVLAKRHGINQAMKVRKGQKYVITRWYRERLGRTEHDCWTRGNC